MVSKPRLAAVRLRNALPVILVFLALFALARPAAVSRPHYGDDLQNMLGGWHKGDPDLNGDQHVDYIDLFLLMRDWTDLQPPFPTQLIGSSPEDGDGEVAVTRETILRFSAPLDPGSVTPAAIQARFGGQTLAGRLHLSPDRRTVTLFYSQTLPASARVRVTVQGGLLLDAAGRPVDADRDGRAGGVGIVDFDTLTLTRLPNTIVCGRVFASEPTSSLAGQLLDQPLEGVRITVDGMEDQIATTTDALGNFRLENVPAGRFFVHVDGRAVPLAFLNGEIVPTQFPDGPYYPFVGKSWDSLPGQEVNVGNVYLPLVLPGSLQDVSQTEPTEVAFPQDILAASPEFEGTMVWVPADSLYGDDGTRGGKVGIAPVDPARLPGALPPGLTFPIVITVQTDGPSNFDEPVSACFPNLDNLPPGTASALWSFNHDTGYFEVVGPMTVSDDGKTVCTDPGVGILAPGWHGTNPGSTGNRGGGGPGGGNCNKETALAASAAAQCEVAVGSSFLGLSPGVGCAVSIGAGVAGTAADCRILQDQSECQKTAVTNAALAGLGCVPIVGGPAAAALTCLNGAGGSYDAMQQCYGNKPGAAAVSNNPLIQQAELLAAAAAFYLPVFGDPKWLETDPAELDLLLEFLQRLAAATEPGSEDGERLSQTEIGILLSSPMPSHLDANDLALLVNRFDQMLAGTLPPSEFDLDAWADGAQTLLQTAQDLRQLGWRTTVDGILNALDEISALQEDFFSGSGAGLAPVQAPLFYKLTHLETGQVRRGQTGPQGKLVNVIIAPNAPYSIEYVNPTDLSYAVTFFRSSRSGSPTDIPRALFAGNTASDSDGDGLVDPAEGVLGTSPSNPDSDDDGVSDGAEVLQGTNPLDNVLLQTGIIASVDTPGRALDVDAANDFAAVADSQTGVTILNVFNGMRPVRLAQISTPGSVRRVACDGAFVLASQGSAGALVIDVADPPNAFIRRTLSNLDLGGDARGVTAGAGLGYLAAASGILAVIDLESGSLIDKRDLGQPLDDVALSGDVLLVLGRQTLFVLDDFFGGLSLLGQVPFIGDIVPGEIGRRLYAGDGIAYIGYSNSYVTVDFSDPASPAIVGQPAGAGASFHDLAANGSGLLLSITSFGGDRSGMLSLYDASDPTDVSRFLTAYDTPGTARSLSIYNGIAYVADGEAGLQVVNYLAPDVAGVTPTITLSGSVDLTGGVIEELVRLRLTAQVADDVQVRNVEFYVNGEKVATDGNYPFEHRFVTPLVGSVPALVLRARVSDTGGNFAWSGEYTLQLTPNNSPPQVRVVYPGRDAHVTDVDTVLVYFSKPMDPATLQAANLQIVAAGPDFQLGTADDVPVPIVRYDYLSGSWAASLRLTGLLPGGAYRGTVRRQAADARGNMMTEDYTWDFFTGVSTPLTTLPYGNPEFPAESQASFVQAADLNQDGRLDLVTVNNLRGEVVVLLNQGNRRMEPLPRIAVGGRAALATVTDLDGDGHADLALPLPNTDQMAVLLGLGDGTFQAPVYHLCGDNPASIAAGDLDGDARPELLVTARNDDTVWVYRHVEAATFVVDATFTTERSPRSLVLADFDDDGDLDAAVAGTLQGLAAIHLNDGGLSGVRTTHPIGTQTSFIGAARLNGDRFPDLFVANPSQDAVSVLVTSATGALQPRVVYPAGDSPQYAAAADLNNDGLLDIVTADEFGDSVTVLFGLPGGAFDAPVRHSAGDSTLGVALADIDADGEIDILYTSSLSASCGILYNLGGGAFQPDTELPTGRWPRAVVAEDFNGDQRPDLAVICENARTLEIFTCEADGSYSAAAPVPIGADALRIAAGDLDGDGDLDLVVNESGDLRLRIFVNDGGVFTAGAEIPAPSGVTRLRGLALGRLDPGGSLDIVALDNNNYRALVYLNDGAGAFTLKGAFGMDVNAPTQVAIGDLDGDGDNDLAVNGVGAIFTGIGTGILLNDGAAVFSASGSYRNAATPEDVLIGDLNNDGLNDLFVSDSAQTRCYVHRNLGGGQFTGAEAYEAGEKARGADLVDIDHDGDLDAVLAIAIKDAVSVIYNNGHGQFQPPVLYGVGHDTNDVAFFDADGDGEWDIVTANRFGDTLSVLMSVLGR